MLRKFIESVRTWVFGQLRRRNRLAVEKTKLDPSSETKAPEASRDPQEDSQQQKPRNSQPDVVVQETGQFWDLPGSDTQESQPTEPVVPYSGNNMPVKVDHKNATDSRDVADIQNSSIEAPVGQPKLIDHKSAGNTDSGHSDQVSTEVKPVTSSSDGSEKPPSDPREDVHQKPGSSSEQPVENSAPDSSKKTEPLEGNALDEKSDSLKSQREKKNPEPPAPRKIPGRRNGPSPSSPSGNGDKPTLAPRPELICRRVSNSWEVVLSADDECNIAEVKHNGNLIAPMDCEYRLWSFCGGVSIKYADGRWGKISLFDDTPLIFKLRNDWEGDGRKVGDITKGYFIVIAPREWRRTGRVRVESEQCTDTDFMAHYFYLKKGESAEDIRGFESYDLPLTTSGYELRGDRVFDDSEDGELFVGDPPRLCPASDIVWARAGEEENGRWKGENFKPVEQSLADVLNGRQGWFFVRVYRAGETHQADSGEFRYFSNLREIRVNDELYTATTLLAPPSTGHSETKLKFVGSEGVDLRPILNDGTHATVQPGGIISAARHPDGDEIRCTLKSSAGSVGTVIKLPRIWWRIQQEEESSEWCDIPLAMTRRKFRDSANAGAAIRLRMPPRIESVRVGFDEERDREYRANGKGEATRISLADFVDYSQIDQMPYENTSLNVQCGKAVLELIRVSADPLPEIISFTIEPTMVTAGETATLRWSTRNVEAGGVAIDSEIGSVESRGRMTVVPAETMTYTLRLTVAGMDEATQAVTVTVFSRSRPEARVRRTDGGWRHGRGFSRRELRSVGLSDGDAKRRSIPVDKRRRSVHQDNIEKIKRLIR